MLKNISSSFGPSTAARKSWALLCLTAILCHSGIVYGILAAEVYKPFAAFNAKVEIDIEDGELEVFADFLLDAGSNGIDPVAEAVRLEVKGGTRLVSITIPAGSFKSDKRGGFTFSGTIDRVRLAVAIRAQSGSGYQFEAVGEGARLERIANPVALSLIIGDDEGRRAVRAKID